MTALKNITANNTARNQQYVAASLETEIIRKNGSRPESPAVKIKTIVQRQQEEKVKQREERAARRARRQGKPDSDGEQERDSENASPTPEPSDALIDAPVKHTRGAGDDEDYETPLKPMDGGKRRVKWDKGLFTQVFLDDIVPGMKAVLKENITTKGCLTPGAKVRPFLSFLFERIHDLTSVTASAIRHSGERNRARESFIRLHSRKRGC